MGFGSRMRKAVKKAVKRAGRANAVKKSESSHMRKKRPRGSEANSGKTKTVKRSAKAPVETRTQAEINRDQRKASARYSSTGSTEKKIAAGKPGYKAPSKKPTQAQKVTSAVASGKMTKDQAKAHQTMTGRSETSKGTGKPRRNGTKTTRQGLRQANLSPKPVPTRSSVAEAKAKMNKLQNKSATAQAREKGQRGSQRSNIRSKAGRGSLGGAQRQAAKKQITAAQSDRARGQLSPRPSSKQQSISKPKTSGGVGRKATGLAGKPKPLSGRTGRGTRRVGSSTTKPSKAPSPFRGGRGRR